MQRNLSGYIGGIMLGWGRLMPKSTGLAGLRVVWCGKGSYRCSNEDGAHLEVGMSGETMRLDEALSIVEQRAELASVDDFISILQRCRKVKNLAYARRLYGVICESGVEAHRAVGNHIVPMFVDCGSVLDAQQAFDRLNHRNEHSWTSLILGYVRSGQSQHAFTLYGKMQEDCIFPSTYTLLALLKACVRLKDVETGRKVHFQIVQKGFETNSFVGSTLVDMYAKSGSLLEAQEVFDKLPVRDVVTWTALIAGFVEHGPCEGALSCFEEMRLDGVYPNAVTYMCCLKACSNIGALDKGRQVHAEIAQKGFDRDLFVGNTLIDMYAKCGSLLEAREVLDKLRVRDVVSWTVLIGGYAEYGPSQDALDCFEQMQLEGISPDAVVFACILKACGNIGAINKGRVIHLDIAQKGLGSDLPLANSLIDFYARCGSLSEAREVFDKLPVRNVVSWVAMINGYGMNNAANMAIQNFEDMQEQNIRPNVVSFTCILTVCSRANLVVEGYKHFKMMKYEYGIVPTIGHYTCMVDLLSRSGHFHEAENFIKLMPYSPSVETWTALLSGCKNFGDANLGQRCFHQLVQMMPEFSSSYVLMANIYGNVSKTNEASRIEELRKRAGAKKKRASALIEVEKKVHEFMVNEKQSKEISAMIEVLNSGIKEEGHVPNLDLVLRTISDEEKEQNLCEHAEKLAVAFGLLNTVPGQTLRLTKNMKMCNNCHDANKVICKIEKRVIIVRDSYCIHHFEEGVCSCEVVF